MYNGLMTLRAFSVLSGLHIYIRDGADI
jgi:hypothetical protein